MKDLNEDGCKPTEPLARRICVFAGASCGANPAYRHAARDLGKELVRRNYGLVYGGGRLGLMGELADTVMSLGGTVVGVIPERLATHEHAHAGVTRLEVVASMHERKLRMASLASAFIALPGGIGTFEELLEAVTWTQLRIHLKPVALYNASGYYNKLLEFLNHATREQFIGSTFDALLLTDTDPQRLIARIESWQAPLEATSARP